MARFTKALRQKIVRDFTDRHGGTFDPEAFVSEVRAKGEAHPAFDWFEWDNDAAAHQYRVDQAREFVRDLRVSFSVEVVGRRGAITIREVEAPFAFSPLGARRGGGGYILTDPTDEEHLIELRRQAARDLRAWVDRYQSVLGADAAGFERAAIALEGAGSEELKAA